MTQLDETKKKLQFLQMLANDTPSAPIQTEYQFCILLWRFADTDSKEPQMPEWLPGVTETMHESISIDSLLALSPLSSVSVEYDGACVVLLYGEQHNFLKDYHKTIKNLLYAVKAATAREICYVVSPPVDAPNLIARSYRIANTKLNQRIFRGENAGIFLGNR